MAKLEFESEMELYDWIITHGKLSYGTAITVKCKDIEDLTEFTIKPQKEKASNAICEPFGGLEVTSK